MYFITLVIAALIHFWLRALFAVNSSSKQYFRVGAVYGRFCYRTCIKTMSNSVNGEGSAVFFECGLHSAWTHYLLGSSAHDSCVRLAQVVAPAPLLLLSGINTLRPRWNGRRFADDTFKRIFLNEDVRISIKISLKFVPKGPINNNTALVQIMAWRRSGDKSLSEPMMVNLLTHICITQPQWVNKLLNPQLSLSVKSTEHGLLSHMKYIGIINDIPKSWSCKICV